MPGLEVKPIASSCCGMAGSFGYQAETQEVSRAMAEASLLPAVRAAAADDLIVADGTSCRHQIAIWRGGRRFIRSACWSERWSNDTNRRSWASSNGCRGWSHHRMHAS